MNCFQCAREINEGSNFCSYCGARQRSTASRGRLMRSAVDSKIAGVCGGIAEYFDVDSTVIRVVWIVLSIVPGGIAGGVLVYLLCWIVMPKAPAPAVSVTSTAPLEQAAK